MNQKELKKALHQEFKMPEYPFIDTINKQLVGHVSECKHCFQCGYMKAFCNSPKSPSKFCFWGWYTGGLIPDSLCPFWEHNERWQSISTNYFINRRVLVEQMIKKKEINENKEIPQEALRSDGIGEYMFKPVNIFLLGADENAEMEKIKERWPWLKMGAGKPIFKISDNKDFEKLKEELRNKIVTVPNIGMVPCMVLKWKDIDDEYYNTVLKIIRDYESVQTVNIATRLVHSECIQENEFENFAWFNHSKWGYDLVGAFKGRTVLCVAGGPTLKKHIKIIKENQDKYIILAASTVAEVLFKEGITPHIIGTIDMKSYNKLYLEALTDEQMKSTHLLFEIDTNHEVVDTYKGPTIMMVADLEKAPGTIHLKNYLPMNNFYFPKSGTVSNMLYDFARMLKPKQIVLAGYDLCYTGLQTHIDGIRTGDNIKVIESTNGKFLQFGNSKNVQEAIEIYTWAKEGDNHKIALTTKAYYTYLIQIELRVRDGKIPTFDIDEDSAIKEGVELINFKKFTAKLPKMQINPHDVINKFKTKRLRNNEIKRILRNPIKGANKQDIRYNHVTKLVYFIKQYNLFPLLEFGTVLHQFEHKIIAATKGAMETLVKLSEVKWRKFNKEEQNG